ncbi:putative exported domain protein, partial [Bacteroides fragilis str. S13 L11]
MKNSELKTILQQKGYQFNEQGNLLLDDLANNTTTLDLSGTKLSNLSELDILPNLTEVKLSDNDYGPVFDFSKLPKQITGIDLTGNDIYDYDNLVNVVVEENGNETVTNLHDITKLYLPRTAKDNIKDLVRFYIKNKDAITNGKIDMKIKDES